MDRRQQKTRRAIFDAFRRLLEKKRYDRITVQEIIDEADVGRSTFYAHFETKETLLEAMCSEVFFHVFAKDPCPWSGRDHDLAGKLAHVLFHVKENHHDLSAILLSDSGEVFMAYFKKHLHELFVTHDGLFPSPVPSEYRLHQLTAAFAETVRWWAGKGFPAAPEEVVGWFLTLHGYRVEPAAPADTLGHTHRHTENTPERSTP